MPRPQSRLSFLVPIWLVVVIAAVYLYVFEPGKSGYFPTCPFKTITGYACPGCGASRGLHQLFHGHFLEAFTLNPLVVVLLPLFLLWLIRETFVTDRRGALPAPRQSSPLYSYSFLVIVILFGIVRNLSFYPFQS